MKEEVDISLEKWLEKEIRISTEDSFTEEKTQNRLDSIIIFEDIQKFIFEFNCEQTKDFDILLINEYLDFLGTHIKVFYLNFYRNAFNKCFIFS